MPSALLFVPLGLPRLPCGNHSRSRSVCRRNGRPSMTFKSPLPPPPTPDATVDKWLGSETGVISVETLPSAETAGWRETLLSSRGTLPEGHPFTQVREQTESKLAAVKDLTRKDESWRFTDLRGVYGARYVQASSRDLEGLDVRTMISEEVGPVLVFVDGVFNAEKSLLDHQAVTGLIEAGGYIGGLERYIENASQVVQMFEKKEVGEEGGLFSMLNTACARDAAVLDVPKEYAVEVPVGVLFISTGGEKPDQSTASATRLAILACDRAKVTVLEAHVNLCKEAPHSVVLASSAASVGPNATVQHFLLNNCAREANFIAATHAEVRHSAAYEMCTLAAGAKLSRHTVGIDLIEECAHGKLHGAAIANGRRVADLHSRIKHDAENTTSDQLQKNLASDRGRTVFNGKVVVTTNGQKTDASQECRSLLVSDKAEVDAMPVLEIDADDVKCSHGATVSDLESDQLFYCQSRGLSPAESRSLLLSGFVRQILDDCPMPSLNDYVSPLVAEVAAEMQVSEGAKRYYASI